MSDTLNRLIILSRENEALRKMLKRCRELHLQFVAAVTVEAGGEIHLPKSAYERAFQCELQMGTDPLTGEVICRVREKQSASTDEPLSPESVDELERQFNQKVDEPPTIQ